MDSDPELILALVTVRLLDGKPVLTTEEPAKSVKKFLEKALQANLLEKKKVRVATTTKAGKASSKSVDAFQLTAAGEQYLSHASSPEAVAAAVNVGYLSSLQASIVQDREALRANVQAALAENGKAKAGDKIGKDLSELAKKVGDIAGRLAKLEQSLLTGADPTLLDRIDEGFQKLQNRLDQVLHKSKAGGPAGSASASTAAVAEVLRQAYERLCKFVDYREGIVDLPKLYHEARKALPTLSVEQFHDEMMRLWTERAVELHILNEVYRAAEPDKGIRHHDQLYYYVMWKRP